MEYDLLNYLAGFVQKRVSDICFDLAKNNSDYKDLQTKLREIEDKLINQLDDNEVLLFDELNNLKNSEIGLIREYVYKKGFTDGVKVSNIVDRLKVSEIEELEGKEDK